MELVFKIAAICLPTAVFVLTLKKSSPAMALLLSIAAGAVLISAAVDLMRDAVDVLNELADMSGMNSAVLAAMLKTVGIAIVTRLAADVMKDAGIASAASAAELAGAAAGLLVCLPVIKTMLSMIRGLV